MRDYLKVQSLFAQIATEDMAAKDMSQNVRPRYYSGMLERIAMDATKSHAPRYCDRALIQCLLEQIGAYNDPCTRLLIGDGAAWKPQSPGFSVRRYEDVLIVTRVFDDFRFTPGDVITKMQNNSIVDYHKQVWRTLRCKITENEDWQVALQFSNTVHVRRGNGEERLRLMRFPMLKQQCETSIRFMDGICIIRLDTLETKEEILDLLRANASQIAACSGTVLDLRQCHSQNAGFEVLLPLLARQGETRNILAPEQGVYMLYSQGNKRLFRAELLAQLRREQNSQVRNEIEALLSQLEDKSGWVFEPAEPEEDGAITPVSCGKLVILSDGETGADAEAFILAAKRLGRATVVGRNSMGAMDYCRPQLRALDDSMALVYSSAMRASAYEGNHMNGIGISADIHIPWTPEFLKKDLDMEAAIDVINS
ncbi:MAG: S41 family peptidase [Clostridia bacterium]|nr:S41 family peptidase [Clostridia bacterium]